MSSKIDWTTLTPAYYYEVWQYAATTGQEHGSASISGTYTQDTTLFSVNFTPKTSGKFLVTMVLPARGGTSGTGFVRLVVDSTQRWCAVPKSGDNSFNTNVITMVFNGNAGTTYSVKMMTLRSNTESITIPDYMGASISIVEL